MTLGEMCVDWCRLQMQTELRPAAHTIAEWFKHATRRDAAGHERPLGVTTGNYCAAAQCMAAADGRGILLSGTPHGFRLGARELIPDAMRHGAWQPTSAAYGGAKRLPRPLRAGDLAIYNRSIPGQPLTAWHGHVNRVTELLADGTGYLAIGANEKAGAWIEAPRLFSNPKLLGFILYPD